MQPFFVVWNEKHGVPKYKHDTLDDAQREASRLAGLYPGESFHVLALVGTARKVDVEFTRAEYQGQDIPF